MRIRRLAARPGVRVEADPPELGTILSAARVAIAPMASGSGIPMKVLEAWAAGVPVVATPHAVEGLQDGLRATLSATSAADWIDAVSRLLSDPAEGARVAELGLAAWRAAYSPNQVRQAIRAAVAAAVGY